MALLIAAQHHVVYNVHVADEAHAKPVLRNKGKTHTKFPDLHRGFVAEILIFSRFGIMIHDLAAVDILKARNRFQKLTLSTSGNAGNAEYFSCTRRKGDIVQNLHAFAVYAVDGVNRQAVLRVFRLASGDIQGNFFSNHHFRQNRLVGSGGFNCVNILTLAQNRHAVGQGEHFVQFMRDNDNCLSVISHIAQDGEELLCLLRR